MTTYHVIKRELCAACEGTGWIDNELWADFLSVFPGYEVSRHDSRVEKSAAIWWRSQGYPDGGWPAERLRCTCTDGYVETAVPLLSDEVLAALAARMDALVPTSSGIYIACSINPRAAREGE